MSTRWLHYPLLDSWSHQQQSATVAAVAPCRALYYARSIKKVIYLFRFVGTNGCCSVLCVQQCCSNNLEDIAVTTNVSYRLADVGAVQACLCIFLFDLTRDPCSYNCYMLPTRCFCLDISQLYPEHSRRSTRCLTLCMQTSRSEMHLKTYQGSNFGMSQSPKNLVFCSAVNHILI